MNSSFFKYLNVSTREEKWGMYVTTVGYSKVEPHEEYPNQKHPNSHVLTWNRGRILNDFYLIFISKGKGVFCSSLTEPKEVEEGTCFFLFPGIRHRYKPDARSGWEEYWVGFHGYYIEQLMKQHFFDPHQPCFHIGLNKELLILFNQMLDVVKSSFVGYAQQIAGITLQILGLISTLSLNEQSSGNPLEKLISKAKFLMQESVGGTVDMEHIAYQLPMGYSAFRKNFKKLTGYSPNQYHLNLRLSRSKELLESTTLSIEEIADQTGFDSIYYFSKMFRKKTGVSPNLYRKQFFESSASYSPFLKK
ncbi:AraC family transcriptional regulator [Terrimonas sp.]|uniref:AraC family transcriptional regulator n=1 Tax=Terrimonas sp. TaxID=1914338 RepID=UPI000D525344|nr:AraC family transcriptional regulator [Terrimonas sp.]PVD50997.1 AraC family transcriptional regulator [Terrimonas sp.]